MEKILFVGELYEQKKYMFIAAKQMNYEICVLGAKLHPWQQESVDIFIENDNLNYDQTLANLNRNNIVPDGIITFWERDVVLCSKLNAYFNLPGLSVEHAELFRDKYKKSHSYA